MLTPVASGVNSPDSAISRAPVSFGDKLRGYLALTKPAIVELLLVTTVPAMFVAQRGMPDIWLIVATVLGGGLTAAGASAFNMWFDRDIDALMKRTEKRPIVQGVVSPRDALIFAVAIELLGFWILVEFVNLTAAMFALAGAAFYAFVYTVWLKRKSPSNIVIGGAAGGFPVLVGWAAVTPDITLAPWVMFAIIFFWTPPHFWTLAFKYKDDYAAAKVPMLPSVAPMQYTALQITIYSILLFALSLLLAPVAQLGVVYLATAVVLGLVFCGMAFKLQRSHSEQTAMALFAFSITYVTLLFGAMIVDQFVSVL